MDASLTRADSARRPRYLDVGWVLLLILGLFFLFAPLADLAADRSSGQPSDHRGTFQAVAGVSWSAAKSSSHGITQYITLLETGYAAHELVFGIMFLVILAIPFRRGERWAWWVCWAVFLAALTYTLTFGRHDSTILARSLVAVIGLPILLLIQVPRFYGQRVAAQV